MKELPFLIVSVFGYGLYRNGSRGNPRPWVFLVRYRPQGNSHPNRSFWRLFFLPQNFPHKRANHQSVGPSGLAQTRTMNYTTVILHVVTLGITYSLTSLGYDFPVCAMLALSSCISLPHCDIEKVLLRACISNKSSPMHHGPKMFFPTQT